MCSGILSLKPIGVGRPAEALVLIALLRVHAPPSVAPTSVVGR